MGRPKKLIDLKTHQDDVKHANFKIKECNSLCDMEANINLVIQLELQ